MSAVSTDDSGSSVATAEQDEIFSKHSDERRLGLEMRRYADGPPVTAQKLAHGRAAAGPGQDFIFFFAGFVHRNASKLVKLPLTTKRFISLRSPTEHENESIFVASYLDILSPRWGKARIGVPEDRSNRSPYLYPSPSRGRSSGTEPG